MKKSDTSNTVMTKNEQNSADTIPLRPGPKTDFIEQFSNSTTSQQDGS